MPEPVVIASYTVNHQDLGVVVLVELLVPNSVLGNVAIGATNNAEGLVSYRITRQA